MLLFGASGHAKVVIDCLRSFDEKIKSIFDDDISKKELSEITVIGKYDPKYGENEKIIIAVGDNKIRKEISGYIKHKFGRSFHKSAIIAKDVKIGAGSVIFHNSVIQSSVKIGKHVIVNTNASIDHDCVLGNFTHIAPNSTLCGGVKVGEGTQIGAGAVVIQNVKIGKWCSIGAGAVIIKDIPDYSVVVGNPGRIIKKVKNK